MSFESHFAGFHLSLYRNNFDWDDGAKFDNTVEDLKVFFCSLRCHSDTMMRNYKEKIGSHSYEIFYCMGRPTLDFWK